MVDDRRSKRALRRSCVAHGDGTVPALPRGMADLDTLDALDLARITGGADDPMGQTVLVAGRPQTCQAVVARGRQLIEHGDDPKISNDAWLRQWRRLDDAYMKFAKPC